MSDKTSDKYRITMSDTISRQAAIDAIEITDWYHQNDNGDMVSGASNEHEAWYKAEDIYRALESVSSAQPEIIRCKDCKHWDGVDTCDVIDAPVWDNDFCSMAERRGDDKTNKSSSC